MIKQGTRKALRHEGTVLLVERIMYNYDENGEEDILPGDLIILCGKHDRSFLKGVVVANGMPCIIDKQEAILHASVAFDARGIVAAEDC